MPEAGRKAASEVIRAGELLLPLTSCRLWGEQVLHFAWADFVGGTVGKAALKLGVWGNCPRYSSVVWWCGQGKEVSPYPLSSVRDKGAKRSPLPYHA